MPDLSEKAAIPRPEDCLGPTEFLDYDHPRVTDWLRAHPLQGGTDAQRAIELYALVRDGWRYNPYNVSSKRAENRTSHILQLEETYCIPKAQLLASFARAIGIPARLGFGDVVNHLSSPRLIEYLKSELFAFHGFAELYLDGQWVRATPAFDAKLCRLFRVAPLEFDGVHDSLFHEYNGRGKRFMEYVRYHGVFADLPFEFIFDSLRQIYPHLFESGAWSGDLAREIEA